MAKDIWLAVACVLVASMQLGFLFVEAGFVRSKNSINVSLKNVADFAVAVLSFNLVGAAIMFGPGSSVIGFDAGLIGYSGDGTVIVYLMMQALFCGTSATIISGAVAERMKFTAYMITMIPLTMLVYPIIGHWAWASGLRGGTAQGWLEALGFIDFAGSSVVHLTGGASALALLLVIGARSGRFEAREAQGEGGPAIVHGHSPILAGGGALILLVGWLGFNSAGLTPGTTEFARAISNTLYAGAAACLAAAIFAKHRDGYFRADRMINGLLVGLVAITASAPHATLWGAIIASALIAIGSIILADWLESRRKIDDAVYAVSVHGFGGLAGTLAVPFVIHSGTSELGFLTLLLVQLLGVAAIGLFAFTAMWCVGSWMHRRGYLRVSVDDELQGLNQSEHRAVLGHASLIEALANITKGDADLSTRVNVDPFEDGGDLAAALNVFLDKVEVAEKQASDKLRAEQVELANMADRESARADLTEQTLRRFQLEFSALVADLKQQAMGLANGSRRLADHSDDSSELVSHAKDEAEATVSIAEQMSQGASLLAQTLEDVARKVAEASNATRDAESASRSGAKIAATLESSIREIGQLVAMIDSISAQTDLLAVNAKIEAMLAGDAGRGFTVISEEIGQLAKKTTNASGEIAAIVNALVQLIGSSIAQFRSIDHNILLVRRVAEEAEHSASMQRETGEALSGLIAEARDKTLASGTAAKQVSESFVAASKTIADIDHSAYALDELAQRFDQRFSELRTSLAGSSVDKSGDTAPGKMRQAVRPA